MINSRKIVSFVSVVHVLALDDLRMDLVVFSRTSENNAHSNQNQKKSSHLDNYLARLNRVNLQTKQP